jgi:hypothetical protein
MSLVKELKTAERKYTNSIRTRVVDAEKALVNNQKYYEKLFEFYLRSSGENKEELKTELLYVAEQGILLNKLKNRKTLLPLVAEEAESALEDAMRKEEWTEAKLEHNVLYAKTYDAYQSCKSEEERKDLASKLEILLRIGIEIQAQLNSNGGTA